MCATKHRRAPGLVAVFAGVAAVITLAGCGGSSTPVVPSLAGSAGHATQAAHQTQAQALHSAGQCIREHGIPGFPDPTVTSSGQVSINKSQLLSVSRAVLTHAFAACRTELTRAGFEAGRLHGKSLTPAQMAQILAFARCMRAHGLPNFPDPAPGTGEITLPPGTPKDSPVLQTANRACEHYLPGAGR
jgi:hypothetical protein